MTKDVSDDTIEMRFGAALDAMLAGSRVRRKGWNGWHYITSVYVAIYKVMRYYMA